MAYQYRQTLEASEAKCFFWLLGGGKKKKKKHGHGSETRGADLSEAGKRKKMASLSAEFSGAGALATSSFLRGKTKRKVEPPP